MTERAARWTVAAANAGGRIAEDAMTRREQLMPGRVRPRIRLRHLTGIGVLAGAAMVLTACAEPRTKITEKTTIGPYHYFKFAGGGELWVKNNYTWTHCDVGDFYYADGTCHK